MTSGIPAALYAYWPAYSSVLLYILKIYWFFIIIYKALKKALCCMTVVLNLFPNKDFSSSAPLSMKLLVN